MALTERITINQTNDFTMALYTFVTTKTTSASLAQYPKWDLDAMFDSQPDDTITDGSCS